MNTRPNSKKLEIPTGKVTGAKNDFLPKKSFNCKTKIIYIFIRTKKKPESCFI